VIPYGRQEINKADIDAVIDVLQSDLITQGPVVPLFEKLVSEYCGAKHAVAVNSGTSALHLACLALKLTPSDILWTVPNTFVASANCGRYCGAKVDFVDIDPNTYNISTQCLIEKLKKAEKNGTLPAVLISVHFSGQPTEQEEIWKLAQKYNFKVIDDASHALGAARNDERVGSCKWSDITVFSFHPVKIITTGEGGMALCNDDELAWRMSLLRSHGITRDYNAMQNKSFEPWYYEQLDLGFNYRMTDIQAALGISQLSRLDKYVERRNILAQRYDELLSELPVKLPTIQKENYSSFHLYVIRLKKKLISKTYAEVFHYLRDNNIGVNLHYIPVHLQPYYRKLGFTKGSFIEAERHAEEAITLPMYPNLEESNQDFIAETLKSAF
jgi:UDP-4-amino-4,6-dideoxy-N-acetyl-beta-L-altrosamine transaminase